VDWSIHPIQILLDWIGLGGKSNGSRSESTTATLAWRMRHSDTNSSAMAVIAYSIFKVAAMAWRDSSCLLVLVTKHRTLWILCASQPNVSIQDLKRKDCNASNPSTVIDQSFICSPFAMILPLSLTVDNLKLFNQSDISPAALPLFPTMSISIPLFAEVDETPNSSTLTTSPNRQSQCSDRATTPIIADDSRYADSDYDWSWIRWKSIPGHSIPLSRSMGRIRGWFWALGVPTEEQTTKKRFWLCKECHLAGNGGHYNTDNGSSAVNAHLRDIHHLAWNKDSREVIDNTSVNWRWTMKGRPTQSVADTASLDASIPREQEIMNYLALEFDENRFRRLLIRWIVYDNISFRQVDGEAFREFIQYLSPLAESAMPCHTTISAWISQGYCLHKAAVKRELTGASSKIHIAFDLWTSNNLLSLNGVVAHFLNKDFKPRVLLLSTPEQSDSHAGVNIAEGVSTIIDEFEIADNLGYFMLDNASNNDTAVAALAEIYGFDAPERRLRCAGHIINLIARHLLFGEDPDLFEAESEMRKDVKGNLKLWRKKGPIGKLHNLVVWTYLSPQRRNRWIAGMSCIIF